MGAEVSYQIVHLHDLGTAKTVCPCQKHFWYGLRAPVRNVVVRDGLRSVEWCYNDNAERMKTKKDERLVRKITWTAEQRAQRTDARYANTRRARRRHHTDCSCNGARGAPPVDRTVGLCRERPNPNEHGVRGGRRPHYDVAQLRAWRPLTSACACVR